MLNIPEAIKTLYKQDSIRKNFRVHFPNGEMPDITNANIVSESVSFTESLCSQQYLKFGLTEASEIQFETVGIGNMLGMTIECYNEIDVTQMPGYDDPIETYTLKDDVARLNKSYFKDGAVYDSTYHSWSYKTVNTTAAFADSMGVQYVPAVDDYCVYEPESTAWKITSVGYSYNSNVFVTTNEAFNTTDNVAVGTSTSTKDYVVYTPSMYVFRKYSNTYRYMGTLDPSSTDYYTLRSSVASAWMVSYLCTGSYSDSTEPNFEQNRAAVMDYSATPYWKTIEGCYETSDVAFPYYRLPYGKFVVEECPRSHGAMTHRRVVARTNGGEMLKIGSKTLDTMMNTVTPFSKLEIDPYAMMALVDPEEYAISSDIDDVLYPSDNNQGRIAVAPLYNSRGNAYHILFEHPTNPYWLERSYANYAEDYEYASDIFKATISGDLETYASFGAWCVEQIDNAGLDLTYNRNRVKVYKSNEDALRRLAPFLFSPCMSTIEQLGKDTITGYCASSGDDYSVPVESNVPTIMVSTVLGTDIDESDSHPKPGFYGTADREIILNRFYCMHSSPRYMTILSGLSGSTVVASANVPESLEFTIDVQERKTYQVIGRGTRYSRQAFILADTDRQKNYFNYYSATRNSSGQIIGCTSTRTNGYSFTDSLEFDKALQGWMELCATYLKPSRAGGMEVLRYDQSNPVEVNTSEYESLWWDEYDVDPIGAVKYKFNDGKDSTVYQFGEGESGYDMSDNYYINHLSNATSEQINALLDELFIPHVQGIIFTPIDLDMKGLPYIESGDYLQIATGAEDVPTVSSFVVNQTISGIQSLMSSVASSGGEIAEELEEE